MRKSFRKIYESVFFWSSLIACMGIFINKSKLLTKRLLIFRKEWGNCRRKHVKFRRRCTCDSALVERPAATRTRPGLMGAVVFTFSPRLESASASCWTAVRRPPVVLPESCTPTSVSTMSHYHTVPKSDLLVKLRCSAGEHGVEYRRSPKERWPVIVHWGRAGVRRHLLPPDVSAATNHTRWFNLRITVLLFNF